jgi:cellulose synthase/poly-beta-1,6-N-acetylglucosamine synthase-like glycosyltransferase
MTELPHPQITVLMTVYNGMSYLEECIDSVLEQTFRDFEFLIVDDASTDRSLEFIKSYVDPRIRIVRNGKNLGQAASLNKGLRHARGEFIARLDQDDVNLRNRLEEQHAYMKARPDVAIVCSYEHTIDSLGNYVCSWRRTIPNYGGFLGLVILGLCPVWHPSAMFRREVVQRLGGYDSNFPLAEDFELWSRMALGRFSGAVVPKFHLLQRVHQDRQSSQHAVRQKQSADRAHERALEAFLPRQSVSCLAALLRLENDPCGRAYNRAHARDLALQLHYLLGVIESEKALTGEEARILRRKVFSRLGPGVWYAASLACLPRLLFRGVFFTLSPALLIHFRAWLSGLGRYVRKWQGVSRP